MFDTPLKKTLSITCGDVTVNIDKDDSPKQVKSVIEHLGLADKIKSSLQAEIKKENIKTTDKNLTSNTISFKQAIQLFYDYYENIKKPITNKDPYVTTFKYLFLFVDEEDSIDLDASFFTKMRNTILKLPARFTTKYKKEDINIFLKKKIDDNEKMSNKTINDMFARLNKFYYVMLEEQQVVSNPIIFNRLPEIDSIEKVAYSDKEIISILNSIRDKEHRNLVLFALYTGCRLGELLSIEVDDLDANGCINIRGTKTDNAVRRLYIHTKLRNVFKEKKKYSDSKFLFFNGQSAKLVSKKINPRLRKIVPATDKSFHSFRKNTTQLLFKNNIEEWKVKKILGHSLDDDVTHKNYNNVDLSDEQLKSILENIDYSI